MTGSSSPLAEQPFVSVVIDNYNAEKYLSHTIQSVLEQDYPHKEIVVVDDGSTDGSRKIIESYGEAVVPVFKENGGQNSCINAGVARSRGEIIFFLDGDDLFYPHKISEMVKIYQKLGGAREKLLIFHQTETINEKGVSRIAPSKLKGIDKKTQKGDLVRISTPPEAYSHVLKYGFLPYTVSVTSGITMSDFLAREIFPLPETIKISSDLFFVRAAMLLGEVYGTRQVLGQHRWHGGNSSIWAEKFNYEREFVEALDRFLNQKLEVIKKRKLFSFYDSIHARTYYRKYQDSSLAMLKWALKIPMRYFSIYNLFFSLRAIGWTIKKAIQKK